MWRNSVPTRSKVSVLFIYGSLWTLPVAQLQCLCHSGRMICEPWNGKDAEGSDRDIIWVTIPEFPSGIEANHEKLQSGLPVCEQTWELWVREYRAGVRLTRPLRSVISALKSRASRRQSLRKDVHDSVTRYAEQNHHKDNATRLKKSLEIVARFKYLATTVTIRNCIHE
jgi:hypothetical protein